MHHFFITTVNSYRVADLAFFILCLHPINVLKNNNVYSPIFDATRPLEHNWILTSYWYQNRMTKLRHDIGVHAVAEDHADSSRFVS